MPRRARPARRLARPHHDAATCGWQGPAAASVLILAGLLARTTPLHDALTGAPVPAAHLVLPAAYVALAPLCDVADAIAGLPLHAHYLLMLTLAATALAWPARRRMGARDADGTHTPFAHTAFAHALRIARAIGVVVAVYVIAVLAPRPVARLAVDAPDAVVVDFHSHTRASHDGRRDFSAAANRAWHAAVGFDVAYVTDHATFASARAAASENPARAGDGTVLLPGAEVRHDGQHLNVLGTGSEDSLAYAGGELHAERFALARSGDVLPRVMLLTIPADLRRLTRTTAGVALDAVELSDASPRGLEQGDDHRAALAAFADRADLAVLAGSDNHGWATNAVAWSVLRIPGWRAMTPDALDGAIRRTIRARRRNAVQVIERRPVLQTATGPALRWSALGEIPMRAWLACRALTGPERTSWLAWLWAPWLLRAALARSRAAVARWPSRTRTAAPAAA